MLSIKATPFSKNLFTLLFTVVQDYVYPDAKDRKYLHYFYKGAQRAQFNVERYNHLKDELTEVETLVNSFFFISTILIHSFDVWEQM